MEGRHNAFIAALSSGETVALAKCKVDLLSERYCIADDQICDYFMCVLVLCVDIIYFISVYIQHLCPKGLLDLPFLRGNLDRR